MTKATFTTFLICFAFFSPLWAQQIIIPDSTEDNTGDQARNDTTQIGKPARQEVDWSLYWFDIRGNIRSFSDSSRYTIIRYGDHLLHNMTGWADYFKLNPRFHLLDFLDSGLPRYITAVNMLPHQTAVRMDGRQVNDPLNGMLNTRNISMDIVRTIETDHGQAVLAPGLPLLNDAINLTRFKHQPREPFTRIKYFEGDFGYTDLDISFARNFGRDLTVELGGYNRDYDATNLRAQNYRTGFHKQYGKTIDWSLQWQKNDNETFMDDVIRQRSYFTTNTHQEVYNDLIFWDDEQKNRGWHFQAIFRHDGRTSDTNADTVSFSKYRDYQYQFSADRKVQISGIEFLASVAAAHDISWGTSLPKKYRDSRFSGKLSAKFPGFLRFTIRPDLGVNYQYDQNIQILPGFELVRDGKLMQIGININQSVRFPSRIERSVRLHGISGTDDLDAERMTNISSQFRIIALNRLTLESGLIWRKIQEEIRFAGDGFFNAGSRSYLQLYAQGKWRVWRLQLRLGGQLTDAEIHLGPKQSAWAHALFRDVWFKGAVKVALSGGFRWNGEHNRIFYHHGLERFYWDEQINKGHQVLFYKLAATVKDAQLFFEMDNTLSTNFSIINGYFETIRRVRFGVNWKLWN